MDEFPLIGGWQCDRSQTINETGVTEVITLHVQDSRNGEILMLVMSLQTALHMGWDMIGESSGFYGQQTITQKT